MLIPLSEVEFINQLHTSPRSQFVEMDESAYHELICKIERVLHWVRNTRTLRPVLVSTNVIQEIA